MSRRKLPNILITGSVGSGKTTLGEQLAEEIDELNFVNTTELIKKENCYDERDEELDTFVLNEDKFCDALEPIFGNDDGGNVMDYHSSDFFPERWFDVIVVLKVDTAILFDRLTSRGYFAKKIENNVQCEIFNISLEEAKEAYQSAIILELPSNTTDDLEDNINLIRNRIKSS